MTEPTDDELQALWVSCDHPLPQSFARAVLAKWGTPPAVEGEPVAWLHPANSSCVTTDPTAYARGIPLYTTPQPTQAQAGAVPLTDGQAKEVLWSEHLRWMRAAGLDTEGMCPTGEWLDHWLTYVRAIERAHGIGIKGGQHGAE